MKNYHAISAYFVDVITIGALVGITLAPHAPWWATIPLAIIGVCGVVCIDCQRFFSNNK